MRTLQKELLRLQGLVSTGVISEDEYEQVLRERRGLTLQPSGRLAVKRSWIGTEVNGERAMPASQSSQRGATRSVKIWKGKPAPEVTAWNAMVKADRVLVAAGCRSMLVKVVKGNARPVTAMQIAMKHADRAVEVADVMAMLKAAVSTAK